MKKIMCAVYDYKAKFYTPPAFFDYVADAQRSFEQQCKNSESTFHRYPEDYGLFHLGFFDVSSGQFEQHDKPLPLAQAKDFLS